MVYGDALAVICVYERIYEIVYTLFASFSFLRLTALYGKLKAQIY